MPEFRWILLGLGLLLLAGIWWSGRRGASQARGGAGLRETEPGSASPVPMERVVQDYVPPVVGGASALREPSISPYEPLRISSTDAAPHERSVSIPVLTHPHVEPEVLQLDDAQLLREDTVTQLPGESLELSVDIDFEPLAELDATDDAVDDSQELTSPRHDVPAQESFAAEPEQAQTPQLPPDPPEIEARPEPVLQRPVPEAHLSSGRFSAARGAPPAARTDTSGRFNRVKPEAPRPIELQKIITLRVLAVDEAGWPGEDLAAALVGNDLLHGRYGVFHRLHSDGRTLFYVASLIEPGSFDPALMPSQLFPGLSLFTVLPGPLEPVATFDLLLATARQLAIDLAGMMQDEHGNQFSTQRAAQLREQVVSFQQQLQAASAS